MNQIRTFNVLTLASILLLAGCFGMGDSAEASDDHDHTPNAAPVISLYQPNYEINCDETICAGELFHAVVDPDGDVITSGWDTDLDGTIDFPVTINRGYTNISMNSADWEEDEDGNPSWTTIAFIAVDANDAATAELHTITSEYYYQSSTGTFTFNDRDAAGTMGETMDDALVHVQMTQGDGLSWAVLKVSIVVDGGASYTCSTDATNECTIGEPAEGDNTWDTSEEITISESGTDLCNGENGGCDVVVTLTKIGVGDEDDKVIATVTAYADGN